MYTLFEVPPQFEALSAELKELANRIFTKLPALTANTLIPAATELYTDPLQHGKIFRIREGAVLFFKDDAILFFLEEGDVIGLDAHLALAGGRFRTDFAVKVDEYSLDDFKNARERSTDLERLWQQYTELQCKLAYQLASALFKSERHSSPEVQHFESGQKIIIEGSKGDQVYTLIEGHADVFVKAFKVGEILKGEIFGVLAAVTGTPRTADVIATRRTMVAKLTKENFVDLIQHRPHTIFKMVEDMARTVVDLNQRVVALSGKSEAKTV